MPTTNLYFSKGTANEQLLYEDLVVEALQIYGHEVYYIPRKLISEDDLFGEDPINVFEDAFPMEMWMEQLEGYEGEKELVSRFGLEIRDQTTFVVSRRRWEDILTAASGTGSSSTLFDTEFLNDILPTGRPNEGDLVYHPTVKKLFEISFVDHDDPFYQIDNLPVYKLYCRTFEYGSEAIDTGIAAIDSIEDAYTLDPRNWRIMGESPITYNEDIRLEQGTDLYSTGLLDLETGTDTGYLVNEDETGAEAILYEDAEGDEYYIIQEAFSISDQMPQADNTWIEEATLGTGGKEAILDFTEINPFGEPTETK